MAIGSPGKARGIWVIKIAVRLHKFRAFLYRCNSSTVCVIKGKGGDWRNIYV